jgi:hypothetical protein
MKCAALVVLVAACGGKSTEECRAEATAVGDLIVEAAREPPSLIWLDDGVRLVTRTDLPLRRDWHMGPRVTVTPTALTFGDEVMADASALAARSREMVAKLADDIAAGRVRAEWIKQPRLVYVLVDPATPWERVVMAVNALAEGGLTAPTFLFEQPSALKPPPRARIDDKLDAALKAEPSERATEFAKLAKQVVEGCEPLRKEFGAVAAVEGEDKAMRLAKAIKPALIACECRIDVPNLRSVMFRLLHVPRPVRGVSFSPDAIKDTIALPAATTWAEASKRFTPALANAELIAK